MKRSPSPYSYPQKRENPFVLFGYIIGATLMAVAVLASLAGIFMGLAKFLKGGALGIAFVVVVAALITVATIKLREWVKTK